MGVNPKEWGIEGVDIPAGDLGGIACVAFTRRCTERPPWLGRLRGL